MSLLNIQQLMLKKCVSFQCIQFSSIILNLTTKNRFCSGPKSQTYTNPLLEIETLPDYKHINGKSVEHAIPILVQQLDNDFQKFEKHLKENETYTWDVISKQETISRPLQLAWMAASHLHSVRTTEDLKEAYQKMQPTLVALQNKMSQSKVIYEALQYLSRQDLMLAQKRILESFIRDMKNSGVHLNGVEMERFNEITIELAKLSTNFQTNVLDSTKQFSYIIHDKKDVEGLPDAVKAMMAFSAAKEGTTPDPSVGPWKLTLDMPCYLPFLKYSKNRELREKAFIAYISRASSGAYDNSKLIESIRKARKENSLTLGFDCYSTLSLSRKMAKHPDTVWDMIRTLKEKVKPVAQAEWEDLQQFAQDNGHVGDLKQWDVAYWSEKKKEHLFNVKEEELRQYFPLEIVLNGLFDLVEKLFGIKVHEAEKNSFPTWNEDVRFFHISNLDGSHVASFYLDPFVRVQEKNGGAWHNHALELNEMFHTTPVSYLICNQRPPVGDVPSLMNLDEVRTLFHEFGHGLQHMLTEVKFPAAAGISNIEWDAVELPSQFMENWLYDWNTMKQVSSHYKTGEHVPFEMFEQLERSKNYHAGMANLRQLYFSALDMEMHTSNDPWMEVMDRVSDEYTLLKPHEEDRFPCGFLHIFAGGYAAGYYSYKWSEVLSADAFSAFEEVGLDNQKEIGLLGEKFRRTILAKGGAIHPEDNYIDFRGRKASVEALLKSYGIT